MSKQASKTSKTSKTEGKADLANTTLVSKALAIGAKTAEAEFALLAPFAKALSNGSMSVRGFQATIQAISERGGYLATLKVSHAQYLVNAYELSALENAPRNIAELCKLAHNMREDLNAQKVEALGVKSKADAVSKIADEAISKGQSFDKVRKNTPAPKQNRKARPDGEGKDSKVKTLSIEPADLRGIATLVNTVAIAGQEFDSETLDAMNDLYMALASILEATTL